MLLTLKNGKSINLELNPIVISYLEEYKGGIKQMREDIMNQTNIYAIATHIAYSVVSASIGEKLEFNEVMKLLTIKDVDKIVDFVISNLD